MCTRWTSWAPPTLQRLSRAAHGNSLCGREAQKQKPSGPVREGHQGGTHGRGLPSRIDKGSRTGTVKAQRRDNQNLLCPSLPSPPTSFSQVKSESLGIPQKLQLKVDVESGKLIIKKSKDGSEDKFYSHKKSKAPSCL